MSVWVEQEAAGQIEIEAHGLVMPQIQMAGAPRSRFWDPGTTKVAIYRLQAVHGPPFLALSLPVRRLSTPSRSPIPFNPLPSNEIGTRPTVQFISP